jgi:hypothetical protein
MALQLRRKTHESIIYIDKDSAPRIMPFGEDFILEDIPVGTRVIYPNPPIKGLPNREAAIRYAVNHPIDAKPLYAQLEPGMRVTIAMDDISCRCRRCRRRICARRCSKSSGYVRGERRGRRAFDYRQLFAPQNDGVGNGANGWKQDF